MVWRQLPKLIPAGSIPVSRTKEEQSRANLRIYRQAFSLLKTARANDKKAAKNGQGKIKLGEYFKEFYESLGETDEE